MIEGPSEEYLVMFKTYVICLTLLVGCTGDNLDADDAAEVDAAPIMVDASIDAPIDADDRIPRPPLPMPSPCDTCVGFSCEAACADAGVDAP